MSISIPQKDEKRCYKCGQTKPLTDFNKSKSRPQGVGSECKSCKGQYQKQRPNYRINLTTKAMRIAGVSREEYNRRWEQQGGVCAICGKPETGRNQWGVKRLATDHNHATGKFRGLLCYACNTKLAIIEDENFMIAAKSYLDRTS